MPITVKYGNDVPLLQASQQAGMGQYSKWLAEYKQRAAQLAAQEQLQREDMAQRERMANAQRKFQEQRDVFLEQGQDLRNQQNTLNTLANWDREQGNKDRNFQWEQDKFGQTNQRLRDTAEAHEFGLMAREDAENARRAEEAAGKPKSNIESYGISPQNKRLIQQIADEKYQVDQAPLSPEEKATAYAGIEKRMAEAMKEQWFPDPEKIQGQRTLPDGRVQRWSGQAWITEPTQDQRADAEQVKADRKRAEDAAKAEAKDAADYERRREKRFDEEYDDLTKPKKPGQKAMSPAAAHQTAREIVDMILPPRPATRDMRPVPPAQSAGFQPILPQQGPLPPQAAPAQTVAPTPVAAPEQAVEAAPRQLPPEEAMVVRQEAHKLISSLPPEGQQEAAFLAKSYQAAGYTDKGMIAKMVLQKLLEKYGPKQVPVQAQRNLMAMPL